MKWIENWIRCKEALNKLPKYQIKWDQIFLDKSTCFDLRVTYIQVYISELFLSYTGIIPFFRETKSLVYPPRVGFCHQFFADWDIYLPAEPMTRPFSFAQTLPNLPWLIVQPKWYQMQSVHLSSPPPWLVGDKFPDKRAPSKPTASFLLCPLFFSSRRPGFWLPSRYWFLPGVHCPGASLSSCKPQIRPLAWRGWHSKLSFRLSNHMPYIGRLMIGRRKGGGRREEHGVQIGSRDLHSYSCWFLLIDTRATLALQKAVETLQLYRSLLRRQSSSAVALWRRVLKFM